jgi:hypothetical protein
MIEILLTMLLWTVLWRVLVTPALADGGKMRRQDKRCERQLRIASLESDPVYAALVAGKDVDDLLLNQPA